MLPNINVYFQLYYVVKHSLAMKSLKTASTNNVVTKLSPQAEYTLEIIKHVLQNVTYMAV